MRIHFLIHESFEAPGAFEVWAQQNNHETTYTRFYQHDILPENTNGFDYLIVMGGPQSPATTEKECPYFHSKDESSFIAKAIAQNKFVLGVCLGAQLIGEALGVTFDHSPNREIGVFTLQVTEKAKEDSIFSTFPESFAVGHWHGDMPGLTPTTAVLATSKGCPRQIVRYTPKVYGFQCHFEFTPTTIENMIQNCAHELEQYKDLPYIENAKTLRSHDFTQINAYLFTFLDAMQVQFDLEKEKEV